MDNLDNTPRITPEEYDKNIRLSHFFNPAELVVAKTELALTVEVPAGAEFIIADDIRDFLVAKVRLLFIVHDNAKLFYTLRVVQGLDKNAVTNDVGMVGILERDITIRLVGNSAQAEVRCLCYGDGNDVYRFKTLQEHHARDTVSSVVVKSVLDGNAKLMARSLILVEAGGIQTNADQVNKNILLSKSASAVSIPMLEVKTNEVKCKHGAAVSRLDDEHRFYLESKGINPVITQQILLEAFLQ